MYKPACGQRRQGAARLLYPFLYTVCVGLTALLLAAPASAQLSLERALDLAQQRSQLLLAHDALARSAGDMAIAAGQPPDMTLKFGLNNVPVTGPDAFNIGNDFMTMASIGVMREFTRPEKLGARAARFEREAEVAQAGRVMEIVNLRRDTATAWLDRHFQERSLALLRAQRDEARLQIDAAEAAYRGGRGAQADIFAARSAVAAIDDRLQQAEQQVAMSTTRLVRWVGEHGRQALGATPDLATVIASPGGLEDLLKNHPHTRVLERQEAVARADADIAKNEKQSDWSMELMFSQRGPSYSNMVSLNFSIPLQGNQDKRRDRELSAKLALVEQLRAQRDEVIRERLAQTRSWLQQWQGNRKRLDHFDSAIVPLGAQRTQAALASYRGGTGTLTAVLEARRVEIEVRMERLRLELETAALWTQLSHLVPAAQTVAGNPPASVATEKQK